MEDAAEQLDALGDGVHQFDLLLKVLIEQEVKLVEGRPGYLPVMLLVHIADLDRVGEQLIEHANHLRAGGLVEDGAACPRSPCRTSESLWLVRASGGATCAWPLRGVSMLD